MQPPTRCFLLCLMVAVFFTCIYQKSVGNFSVYIQENLINSTTILKSGRTFGETRGKLSAIPAEAEAAENSSFLPTTTRRITREKYSATYFTERRTDSDLNPSEEATELPAASSPVIKTGERFLTFSHFGGRLGNQLFSYVSTLGIAADNNMSFVYPPPENLAGEGFMYAFTLGEVFTLDTRRRADRPPYDGVTFQAVDERTGAMTYDRRTREISPRHADLRGYFQSWRYFSRLEARLRETLTFTAAVQRQADQFYRNVSMVMGRTYDVSTLVGVHVRRGDILTHPTLAEFGYTAATEDYFHRAAAYYSRQLPLGVVFVVSAAWEDAEWARHVFSHVVRRHRGAAAAVYTHGRDAGVDMAVLARCRHSVISTGTFSWWAGWLAGGQVVYYKDWPRAGSGLERQIVKSDYFKPDWIPM